MEKCNTKNCGNCQDKKIDDSVKSFSETYLSEESMVSIKEIIDSDNYFFDGLHSIKESLNYNYNGADINDDRIYRIFNIIGIDITERYIINRNVSIPSVSKDVLIVMTHSLMELIVMSHTPFHGVLNMDELWLSPKEIGEINISIKKLCRKIGEWKVAFTQGIINAEIRTSNQDKNMCPIMIYNIMYKYLTLREELLHLEGNSIQLPSQSMTNKILEKHNITMRIS